MTAGLDKALRLIQSGDRASALALLDNIDAASLVDPNQRYRLAQTWLELGRFEKAVPALRAAADAMPDNAMVWNDLGACLSQLGDQAGALDAWGHAAGVRPVFPPALYNHALALEAQGKLNEARNDLETALQAAADLVPVLALLGRICAASSDNDAASRVYQRVLELEPKHFDAAFGAACIDHDHGRFEEAAAGFERCLEIEPSDFQSRLNLALSLQELGRMDKALDHYREILRRDRRRYYTVVKTLLSAARGMFWLRADELRRQLLQN